MRYLTVKATKLKLEIIKIYKSKNLYYCKDEKGVEYMINPDRIEVEIE